MSIRVPFGRAVEGVLAGVGIATILITAAASSASAQKPRSAVALDGRAPTGRLPRPVAYYAGVGAANRGAEFRAFVDGLYWGGRHRQARPGCANAACTAKGGATAFLSIEAVHDARLFNPSAAGANGTVVARIVNHGGNRDFRYHTRPGREYYLVVSRSSGGAVDGYPAPWELIELQVTASAVITARTAMGTYRLCGKAHSPGPSQARFDGCPHGVPGPFENVSCDLGCCEPTDPHFPPGPPGRPGR